MKEILIVMKKEIREMLRDKRVRSAMIIGPFFSVALMFMLFGLIGSSISGAKKTTLHVVNPPTDAATTGFIEGIKKAGMQIKEIADVAEGEKLIREGKAKLILDFGPGLSTSLSENKQGTIHTYVDPDSTQGQIAGSIISKAVSETGDQVVKSLLSSKGLDPKLSRPLLVKQHEVKVGESKSSQILIQLLPYLLVIWGFFGAMSMAGDTVAGEKERQTLETLLISPVDRNRLAIGKLLALAIGGLTATTSALAAILIFCNLNIPQLKFILEGGLGITSTGILVVVVTVIPTVILFVSLLMAVSSYSRNIREAQTYLSQLSLVVTLPAVLSQVIGMTSFADSKAIYLVPILNVANVIRNALMGRYDALGIAMTVGLNLVLASIAILYCVRQFHKETILNRI